MNRLTLSESLWRKYDASAPRYTSYPPIPYWPAIDEGEWNNWIEADPDPPETSLSLYVHVPFCASRCYYCGCLVVITNREDQGTRYAEAVKREMALVRGRIKERAPVRQFHFGGGTPTFLSVETLADLVKTARELFPFDDNPEMSIEVDPRTVTPDKLARLRDMGFNRISLGVQDFDETVQELVNRRQPFQQVQELTEAGRRLAFQGINYDLIYGLPGQTRESFAKTMDLVCELGPDRVALYHYAHLPRAMPYQRRFTPDVLPDKDTKLDIFLSARERFLDEGYVAIGLDHFARDDDDLTVALRKGTMQRNFMGYTTRAGEDMLAFGISAISDYRGHFWQNEKKLNRYYKELEADRIPVTRGMRLAREDRLRKALIMDLFCGGRVDFADLRSKFEFRPEEHFAKELEILRPMAQDGLVALDEEGITVTEIGQFFLRNVAVVFDAYHKTDQSIAEKFSRTV